MSGTASASAPPAVSPRALRIVLFGMPDAGKSSLLGALAQAARTQEHLLNGRLTDLSNGLGELQRRVYEDRPRDTLDEVVPYPTTFEPFPTAGVSAPRQEALFIDCDGRVANELLFRRRSLEDGHSEQNLAYQVMDADALLLVVDASAGPVQMGADFAEFARFLRLLEQSRGRRSEVGGLPVFLVLTKCDLLAKPDDAPATWIGRIEERKQQVKQRFQAFLANEKEGPLPFGSIDLHPATTAVKYPALADSPGRPREPFGVAELFRQCLEEAQVHRQRERASGRRLGWTVAGSAGLVTALAALAVSLFNSQQTTRPTPLESRVELYRSNEDPSVSARLREPLQRKISALTEIKNDPDFGKLPAPLQDYVNERLQELQDYRTYKERLQRARPPESARSERDLDEIKARLEDELAPPPEYRAEWAQTEAVLLRKQRLEDLQALRDAATQVEKWYRGLRQRGDELWTFTDLRSGNAGPLPWDQWQGRVRRLLAEAETPPFRRSEFLPGSRSITYAVVFRFDRVEDARGDWEKVRGRLDELRNLAAALGLIGVVSDRPALLDFEDKPVSLPEARARLQELEKTYPGSAVWPKLSLPEAVATEVRRSAGDRYQLLLPAGREAILRQLQLVSPDGKETPEHWRAVREWLSSTRELDGWRELAALLARLHDPKAEGPVDGLLAFLNRDRFELEMDGFTLTVPDDWKARPVGALTVYHRAAEDAKAIAYVFPLRGEGRHDAARRVTEYTFRRDGRALVLYRPGDSFWAELPVSKDAEGGERRFVWRGCRSLEYQFERLSQPPRIEGKGQKEGEIAKGVRLTASPENGVPRVPDLLPVVILKKSRDREGAREPASNGSPSVQTRAAGAPRE